MLLKRIFLILLLAGLPSVWAQCTSRKVATYLVSDRYRDAAEYGKHLILANAHGLVYRDLDNLANVLHIEPLGGDVVEVHVLGNRVFATARDTGIYVFDYKTPDAPPSLTLFQPIPKLQSITLGGEAIFANLGDQVNYYRFDSFGRLTLVGQLRLTGVKIRATESLLFVHRPGNSGIGVYPFVEAGFRNNVSNLSIDGNTSFYDMELAGDTLVVDGLNAVSWIDFTPEGNQVGQGTFFRNQGSDIVFAFSASDTHLYLRFADRLDIYQISANHQLSLVGKVAQGFSEIGITRMVPTPERLHVLNFGRQEREWSLETYQLGSNSVTELVRLDANFEEISAAANAGSYFYLGSDSRLFLVADSLQLDNIANLTPVATFEGTILEMTGSDSLLYVATLVPDTAFTRLQVLEVQTGGNLVPRYSEDFQGTISELRQDGDRLSFVQFFNTTSVARYQAHVLRRQGDSFDRQSLLRDVAIQDPNPFADLQISDLGLVFHTDNRIFVHPDSDNLQDYYSTVFVPGLSDATLIRLYTQNGYLWAEFGEGLVLLRPNNRNFEQAGVYPLWHDLTLLPSNQLLASSNVDPGPGRFHLLTIDQDDTKALVYALFSFSAPTLPIFLTPFGEDLLIADKSSINLYEMVCPSFDYLYLVPMLPGLELEITSDLDETDAVVLNIYNADSEVIGVQTLSRELIGSLNRKPIIDWLVDINSLETPHSFLLRSSKPLYPILSGYAAKELRSRFALTLPPYAGSDLYLPHIPSDESSWETDLVIRNWQSLAESTQIVVKPAVGGSLTQTLQPNGTDVIHVGGRGWQDWAHIQLAGSGGHLAGFALYRRPAEGQAAALPLTSSLSDFFLVPYLASRGPNRGWTGLVLSNPDLDQTVSVRVVGYDLNGDIIADRNIQLTAGQRLVESAEIWLEGNATNHPIQWLAVIAEQPIMGLVLYGDTSTSQLAGLPLYPYAGQKLTFVGVRANAQWWTDLVITNTDATDASVRLDALNGAGSVVATLTRQIDANQSLRLGIDQLFAALGGAGLDSIQTVRVTSQALICGSLLRGLKGVSSLEACSPGYQD